MRGIGTILSRAFLCGSAFLVGLGAQQLRSGDPLWTAADIKWLRPLQRDAEYQVSMLVLLPVQRWQYIRSLRIISELQSDLGDRVRIIGLLSEHARGLAAIRLRAPSPVVGLAIDASDRIREVLTQTGADLEIAQVVILDAQGRLLWTGELDPGLSILMADLLAERIDAGGLCQLMELERTLGLREMPAVCQGKGGDSAAWTQASRYWQSWAAEMRSIRQDVWSRDGLALVEAAIQALGERPEYLARILRLALERQSDLGGSAEVAASIVEILAGQDSAQTDLLGFVWHAQRREDESARSETIRYMERFKGVSARLLSLHRRLGLPQYGNRFIKQQLAALDLASVGETSVEVLREKFALLTSRFSAFAVADRVGHDLVTKRSSDLGFLNSFAWKLLTEPPFVGRMNALALHAAQTMRKQEGWHNYWRLDTLALALFANGHIAEAIEIQQRALAECEVGSRVRYTQRLERYQQALGQPSPGK